MKSIADVFSRQLGGEALAAPLGSKGIALLLPFAPKRFLLIASLGVLSITPMLAATEGNLLPNGGFESWSPESNLGPRAVLFENVVVPSGWVADLRSDQQTGKTPLVAKDTIVKHGGDASVRLELVAGGDFGLALRVTGNNAAMWLPGQVQISPGIKYVFRGWYKGENLELGADGRVFYIDVIVGEGGDFFGGKNHNRYVTKSFSQTGSTGWTPFAFEFETSPAEVAVFWTINFQGGGKIWLDDLELVPAP